jgi:hypothetical protein
MAHCLDANTFIEAKKRYYAFDFCPAFWSWLDREKEAGRLICIRPIYDEIADGGDELAIWIKDRRRHAWLSAIDAEEVQLAYRRVVAHVDGRRDHYTPAAVDQFLRSPDAWLIAFCLAHGHKLVTHEISEPNRRNKVKIPDVCNALGVAWADTFEALRELRAQFVLDGADG